MKKRWYVIGADDDLTSWDDKKDKGESFPTKGKAIQRACDLAKIEPHRAFFVCETMLAYVVETKPVQSVRLVGWSPQWRQQIIGD